MAVLGPGVVSHRLGGDKVHLPTPDAAALQHSAALVERIRAAIDAAGGVLPFAEYMELALYAPGLGYYQAGQRRFGPEGDFVTAPELGALFGRVLAQVIGADPGVDGVLEFGAGTGALAAQIRKVWPTLPYAALETSPALAQVQQASVPGLRQLSALPTAWQGVILANEVLDALPVQVLDWDGKRLWEMGVAWRDGALAWQALEQPPAPALAERLRPHLPGWPIPYRTEVNLRANAWLRAVSAALQRGRIILIDYGYPTAASYYHPQRSMGSLRAYYRHHWLDDPFRWPGLCDLTAHVDFSALLDEARLLGLRVQWFGPLARFLLQHGLLEAYQEQLQSCDERGRLALNNEVKRLTLPQEMGESFQVLILERSTETWP
ncbi:SAM-dependent methyltransferase [Candidatus Igneacidithiobacillus taiwanensis]|uniref:class I SAM-dependent methyltransferase n=1 Tax=Candidatus Igneacidithiobacillus taiwanensis TaxID=1945924 RepID=UPI00289AC323|nr:SAM-dependent methyltransferase [Candidatus Igneacidithiobacillus taiwanensis]